jgi:hypothetical protein
LLPEQRLVGAVATSADRAVTGTADDVAGLTAARARSPLTSGYAPAAAAATVGPPRQYAIGAAAHRAPQLGDCRAETISFQLSQEADEHERAVR